MFRNLFSLLSLFVLPAAVLMIPLDAQADPGDPAEVGHMKSGHKKVEGVVSEVKSGLYTVQTSTGTTYTLTESAAVRQGREVLKVGDEMTFWVNEGAIVMDAHVKGTLGKAHRFISGTLASLDYNRSQMTLSTTEGDKNFKLKPESRMFTNIAAGAHVRIEMNETGEVIDIHEERK
ncbi:MAG: hypothetical protein ABI988_06695 [Nitrospirota bacterium]